MNPRPVHRRRLAPALGLVTLLAAAAAVVTIPPLRAEPPPPPSPSGGGAGTPAPASPLPLRVEATPYPRDTPDLRIRFPAGFTVTEAPNGAVLAAPADSSCLMTLFPAPDARDARVAASAAQELIGYLRLATKLEVSPVEEVRTASGQVFYLVGAVGRDLLGKDIVYEVAVGTPEENGGFYYAVAAVYPTEASRRAHAAEFRESVRSIRAGEEDPGGTAEIPGPAKR